MIQDLHSHTYYSMDATGSPEELVEAAVSGGIDVIGITDHNYWVGYGRPDFLTMPDAGAYNSSYGRNLRRYFDHIGLVREKYAGKIDVRRGIEICTHREGSWPLLLPENEDISFFDFCLIENLDNETSITGGDVFSYAKRCGTEFVGIAHTDLFRFIDKTGYDPLDYFSEMAKNNIFWELNVNYDRTHGFHVHGYVDDFFSDYGKQETVRRSGVLVSIGFDNHVVGDYRPDRVREFNEKIDRLGIKKPFE